MKSIEQGEAREKMSALETHTFDKSCIYGTWLCLEATCRGMPLSFVTMPTCGTTNIKRVRGDSWNSQPKEQPSRTNGVEIVCRLCQEM